MASLHQPVSKLLLAASACVVLSSFSRMIANPLSPPPAAHPTVDTDMRVWGDMGDGTYRNPVLNCDFADVDIERDGDRWVMITSTNHLAPGMTLLESQDLVNWRYLGHVWNRLSWSDKFDNMAAYGFGVWAGDLIHVNGTWFCYQIDFRNGLYVSTATDLRGPWSEPRLMLAKTQWTDPAAFYDEDEKQMYLVCNFDRRGQGNAQINSQRLFKLTADGLALADEGKVIYEGPRSEACKIHKINGKFYVMSIDWLEAPAGRDRKQICLRSTTDSIYGPYERKVVLERADGPFTRSSSQGSLVQTDDGGWWYFHQLIQNGKPVFQGRPQMLEPVTWKDGWPIIGQDIDADGIGEPVWQHAKPIDKPSSFTLQTSDDFSATQLGPQWNWNHNPFDTNVEPLGATGLPAPSCDQVTRAWRFLECAKHTTAAYPRNRHRPSRRDARRLSDGERTGRWTGSQRRAIPPDWR